MLLTLATCDLVCWLSAPTSWLLNRQLPQWSLLRPPPLEPGSPGISPKRSWHHERSSWKQGNFWIGAFGRSRFLNMKSSWKRTKAGMHGWVLPFQYFSCVLKPGWNCHHSNFAFNPDRWISTSMTKTRGGHMQGKIVFPDCVRRGNRWPVKTKHAVSSCKKMSEFQYPLLTKQSNERQPLQFSESILTSASFSSSKTDSCFLHPRVRCPERQQ